MRALFVLALVALGCGGTSASSTGATEPVAVQPSAPAPTSGPLATIVVRPDRWPEVSATVATLFGSALPDELRARLDRPEDLLSLQSRRWAAATELSQIDRTRPVVVRLFEPRVHGLATIARTITEDRPTLRHVILVPSERPAELEAALVSLLECPPIAAPTSGPRSGRAHQCDAFVVGFAPREGELVIAIGDPDVDVAPRSAFETDPGDTPLAIELRAEPLRDVGVARTVVLVRDALGSVAPEYHRAIHAVGVEELMAAYVRSSAHGREIGALRLWVEPRMGVRFDAQLTALGARLASAPSAATSPSVEPAHVAPVHLRSSLPLRAMRDATPLPVGYRTVDDPRDLTYAVRSCGVLCRWQALSAPLAHAALLRRLEVPVEHLSIAVDPTLPPGTIDVDVDPVRLGDAMELRELVELLHSMRTIHLRSRVRGARWFGVISTDPSSSAGELSDLPALESLVADEGSLLCLERLGLAVSRGVGSTAGDSTEDAALLAQARADATRAAECVRAPSLLAERAEWLALLEP